MLFLNEAYDWYDIVLLWNRFQSLDKVYEVLVKKHGDELVTPENIRRDFKLVREYWRNALNDGTFISLMQEVYISITDIGSFLEPRRKMVKWGD